MAGIDKRSVTIAGHRTSVSLEEPFWRALGDMARNRGLSQAALVAEIDSKRTKSAATQGLSSALRVSILEHYWAGAAPEASTKSSQTGAVRKLNRR